MRAVKCSTATLGFFAPSASRPRFNSKSAEAEPERAQSRLICLAIFAASPHPRRVTAPRELAR